MPCWEVNLISVEFSGKSVALLRAIGAKEVRAGVWQVGEVTIDTKRGVAKGEQSKINSVKRAYSREAVRMAARKKGWTLTKKANRKYVAVKY